MNLQRPEEPDLQSGAIPITLYLPIWRRRKDLNPQVLADDCFLDSDATNYALHLHTPLIAACVGFLRLFLQAVGGANRT